MMLPYVDQIIRSRRKTIAIIKPDGRVIVRAPLRLASEKIRAWVKTKTAWIAAKKAEMQQRGNCSRSASVRLLAPSG